MDFNFVNPNEMSKQDFEAQKKFHNWEVYTEQQIAGYGLEIGKLIQKSVDSELNAEEKESLKVGKAELKNLKPVLVVDHVDGRLVKSLFYVQEPQVKMVDTLEKSTDGTPVQKIIFLDTPLNKELGRAGQEIIKGDQSKQSDLDGEMWKAINAREDFMKACEYMEKGMGDDETKEELRKAYPDMTDQDYKNFKKGFARKKHDEYMEKALSMKKSMEEDDKQ